MTTQTSKTKTTDRAFAVAPATTNRQLVERGREPMASATDMLHSMKSRGSRIRDVGGE